MVPLELAECGRLRAGLSAARWDQCSLEPRDEASRDGFSGDDRGVGPIEYAWDWPQACGPGGSGSSNGKRARELLFTTGRHPDSSTSQSRKSRHDSTHRQWDPTLSFGEVVARRGGHGRQSGDHGDD